MRRIIIDTDTASDDAVALIMALREPDVKVEAITVVAGNVPLQLAVKNALISVQMAGTYCPPVYAGMAKPLLRKLYTAEYVHGADGMGEMNLPEPTLLPAAGHAVDAMLSLIDTDPTDLELITLGPLTNVAMACLKAPETMRKLKRITIMGGAGLGPGNITPVAEFNIYVDAEACAVVLESGIPLYFVGWDVSMGTAFITPEDMQRMNASGLPAAQFCVRCNESLRLFNLKELGKQGFDLPDPATIAAALYPDLTPRGMDVFASVEYRSELTYGQLIFDSLNLLNRPPNARLCTSLDGPGFKAKLFQLLGMG